MDEDDADRDVIPGRVVTGWSTESGPWLAAFNPPSYSPNDLYGPLWLSQDFSEQLKKLKNWDSIIQDGYTLRFGTARAVESKLEELK